MADNNIIRKITRSQNVFDNDIFDSAIGNDKKNGYSAIKIEPSNKRVGSDEHDASFLGITDSNIKINLDAKWETIDTSLGSKVSGLAGKGLSIGAGALNADKLLTGSQGLISSFMATSPLRRAGVRFGQQYQSKLFYNGTGTHLKLQPKIKIVDWEGTGEPIKVALLLMTYCVPKSKQLFNEEELLEFLKLLWTGIKKNTEGLADAMGIEAENFGEFMASSKDMLFNFANSSGITDLTSRLKSFMPDVPDDAREKIVESAKMAKNYAVNTGRVVETSFNDVANEDTRNAINSLGESVPGNIKQETIEELEDALTIRYSPRPVNVKISNYFEIEDMVITNVELEFSKQVTKTGPLSLTANVSMTSRKEIASIEETGIYNNGDFVFNKNDYIQDSNLGV